MASSPMTPLIRIAGWRYALILSDFPNARRFGDARLEGWSWCPPWSYLHGRIVFSKFDEFCVGCRIRVSDWRAGRGCGASQSALPHVMRKVLSHARATCMKLLLSHITSWLQLEPHCIGASSHTLNTFVPVVAEIHSLSQDCAAQRFAPRRTARPTAGQRLLLLQLRSHLRQTT